MSIIQTQQVTAPDSGGKQVWFTGYISASATQLTSVPFIGVPLFYDDAPNAAAVSKGVGLDATQCLTANLNRFAGIVQGGEPQCFVLDSNGKAQAGWMTVVSRAEAINVWTHANATLGVTALAGVTGQWYLATTNALAAVTGTTTPTIGLDAFTVALALETADTSTTSALKAAAVFGGRLCPRL